jgi:hypothetical protein
MLLSLCFPINQVLLALCYNIYVGLLVHSRFFHIVKASSPLFPKKKASSPLLLQSSPLVLFDLLAILPRICILFFPDFVSSSIGPSF